MPKATGRGARAVRTESTTGRETAEQRRVREFLQLAGERFQRIAEAESKMRQKSLDDVKFSLGEQWDPQIETERKNDRRPCMTLNRCKAFIKQVTNNQRSQRKGIVVNPVGNGSDPDTAKIFEGIIRHIEVNSDSEIAEDHAFDWMVRGGFAYWRYVDEYVSDDSFDVEIKQKWIEDPFSVYFDSDCAEYDGSDARKVFIVRDFGPEEYKSQHPNSKAASLNSFSGIGNTGLQYGLNNDRIRVAEYFYVEDEIYELVQLEDGTVFRDSDYQQMLKEHERALTLYQKQLNRAERLATARKRPQVALPEPPAQPTSEAQRRTVRKRILKWAKINAVEILEERTLKGKYIPIVRLLGDSLAVDGKRHVQGLIRDIKDPQRGYNYAVSAVVEKIALKPKSPWMVAEGQDEGYEREYEESNRKTLAVMHYVPKSVDGSLVPPPSRQEVNAAIDDLLHLLAQMDNDLKAITGLYDASLGKQGPDQSGRAILARQKQGDLGSSDFADNLTRAKRYGARILVDLIPYKYDAARVQRIIKPDGEVQHVGVFNSKVGNQTLESVRQLPEMQAIQKIYDLGVGQYDIILDVGASDRESRRQEAVNSMMTLVESFPAILQVVADLLVRNMDWPGAKEIADRLKKWVPPQFLDDQDESPEAQAARLQAQAGQMQQQLQALSSELQQAKQAIETKQVEQNAKVAMTTAQERTKIALALIDRGTKLGVAEIQTKAQEDIARGEADQELHLALHDAAHEVAMAAAEMGLPAQPGAAGTPIGNQTVPGGAGAGL